MKRITLSFLLVTCTLCLPFAQSDDVGSGRAIRFDGIDDYIDLGNIFDDLQLPFTVSAWVYLEESSGLIYPVLVSQDNAPVYNGFWFCLSSTNLFVEYGDGRGDQSVAFRKGKSAEVNNLKNRWIHVSTVFKTATDIQLYANGYNVGGVSTGVSDQPMASDFPADVAKVGHFFTNAVLHRFKGVIDELRVWNRSLSEDEIRQTMCKKIKGDESGLIGYWTFNEIDGDVIVDSSPSGSNGQIKGNATRVFSGAPIGDESVFLYATNWAGKSLVTADVSVMNITGNPHGLHVYQINDQPSQSAGLIPGSFFPPYYGIFLASSDTGNMFDLTFEKGNVCEFSERKDNSVTSWSHSEATTGFSDRIEVIPYFEADALEINLGRDTVVCNNEPKLLYATSAPGRTYLWSTGHTTPSISVSSSGSFWVAVRQACLVDRDTIQVLFQKSPPAFSLGPDEIVCRLEPRTLTTGLTDEDYAFEWQDGSKQHSFQVPGFGTYWLKLKNACGTSVDSVTFLQKQINDFQHYNFMSPANHDDLNDYFAIDERLLGSELTVFNRWGIQVYHSNNYQNHWDGDLLNSGIYFYTISGECFKDLKGTVTIIR